MSYEYTPDPEVALMPSIGGHVFKSFRQWCEEAAKRPNPQKLWKTFWHEGECCCLFADSNLGKSVYAMQIGMSIAETQPVLYYDYELSDKIVQLRYTDEATNEIYPFPSGFIRAEMSQEAGIRNETDEEYVERIIKGIEQGAFYHKINVIIIDNISYLCTNNEKGDIAGRLMMRLVELKRKHGWSILVIAHTPKRDLSMPINQNSLAGSKKLMNFFDSAFAIGLSAKDADIVYIKQIKCRNGKIEHGADNVITAEVVKEGCKLFFRETGTSTERAHLRERSEKDDDAIDQRIIELNGQGMSLRKIADELRISFSRAQRAVKNHASNQ